MPKISSQFRQVTKANVNGTDATEVLAELHFASLQAALEVWTVQFQHDFYKAFLDFLVSAFKVTPPPEPPHDFKTLFNFNSLPDSTNVLSVPLTPNSKLPDKVFKKAMIQRGFQDKREQSYHMIKASFPPKEAYASYDFMESQEWNPRYDKFVGDIWNHLKKGRVAWLG